VAQKLAAVTFISQQQSGNVHPLLFQFLGEHSGNSRAQLSVSDISNYHLHPPTRNSSFVCYCLPINSTVLPNHFINAITVSLVRCCSWSPTTLLVIRTGMSEVCIVDTCSPKSIRRVLMSTQCPPWMTFNRRWMQIGGTFYAFKNWVTARCLFHIDIVYTAPFLRM
jgi:hypothetical protein